MNRRRSHSPRGFTLIELLIAIALLGLMALMSWRGIDSMVRTQQQTKARGDALLTLQAALGQWGADLDALVALPYTTPIDWDGQALRMTRRSSAGGDAGALVVAWSQREVAGTTRWRAGRSSIFAAMPGAIRSPAAARPQHKAWARRAPPPRRRPWCPTASACSLIWGQTTPWPGA